MFFFFFSFSKYNDANQQAGPTSQPAEQGSASSERGSRSLQEKKKRRKQVENFMQMLHLLTRQAGGGWRVWGVGGGVFYATSSLIYCLLGYIRIYIETNKQTNKKKSALNIILHAGHVRFLFCTSIISCILRACC